MSNTVLTCPIRPDRFCSTTKPRKQMVIARSSVRIAGNKKVPQPRSISGSLRRLAQMRAQRNGSEAEGKGDRTSTANDGQKTLSSPNSGTPPATGFIPTLMALATIALAFMTLTLDRAGKIGPIEKLGWSYTGGPDGARSLLSAIAGFNDCRCYSLLDHNRCAPACFFAFWSATAA